MANIARPTPNQPVCVKLIIALGSQLPLVPKLRRASMSSDRPLSAPIQPRVPV